MSTTLFTVASGWNWLEASAVADGLEIWMSDDDNHCAVLLEEDQVRNLASGLNTWLSTRGANA